MSAVIGSGGIRHKGIHVESSAFPWYIAAGVTLADVGKAMSIDTSANCTAKLSADGEPVIGKLASFEDRVQEGIRVGTVDHTGGFEYAYTGILAVGDSVVGSATAGSVKAATGANGTLVTSVDAGAGTCQVVKL
jgi:hypothetical protein